MTVGHSFCTADVTFKTQHFNAKINNYFQLRPSQNNIYDCKIIATI